MQVIAHNMLAQYTNRQMGLSTGNKSKNTEKLSSGYRINRAGDDAAGLAISEKMRWQIRGLDKGSDNINTGIDLIKTADGALAEVHSVLQRARELTVQAYNDTYTRSDREHIQEEVGAILEEIDRIGEDTTFNTLHILQGNIPKTVTITQDTNLDGSYKFRFLA